MGRVLVKSALPGKVLVKSNYAFDAFGNPVLLSTPSTKEGAPVRGERLAGILGGAAGAGLALTQPVNSLSQLINNIRYGMFEGARDARGLRRGLSGRREKIRANRAADLANQYAAYRSQESPAEARQRGMFDRLTGGNFMTAGQQEQELYEANVQRRLADERAARNAALGQEVFNMAGGMLGERPEDLTLQQGQGILGNIKQLGMAGAQLGNRIDVPEMINLPQPQVELPNQFALQNPELMADIEQELQTVMPQEGDVNVTKPSQSERPIVNVAGKKIGVVGSGDAMTAMRNIPPPSDDMGAADAKEEPIPPNTRVNTPMDTYNQMKPESDEEEGGQQPPSSMLRTGIENKLRNFESEVEA
tara:strand:- start:5981 stop:7063 length:1083 start_codon:yes stop_codon:yes gene_type:complete